MADVAGLLERGSPTVPNMFLIRRVEPLLFACEAQAASASSSLPFFFRRDLKGASSVDDLCLRGCGKISREKYMCDMDGGL